MLAFTFIPAAVVGYINSQYWRHSAIFVWTIPTVVLGYKLITFHTTVFQNHFEAAFHYYFAGGFLIGEFYSYTDLFALGPTPDMFRGIDQLHSTGPFYAGLGYSLAAFAAGYVPFSALAKLLPEHRSDAIPEEHEVEGP
ncbi:MAG TPA: hypothetical protein VFE61_16335 [Candidatus Sulfotelmatobacter sp.]|nr:hypothetical protein [Candidatus Sulfotelmatobacter sp.]